MTLLQEQTSQSKILSLSPDVRNHKANKLSQYNNEIKHQLPRANVGQSPPSHIGIFQNNLQQNLPNKLTVRSNSVNQSLSSLQREDEYLKTVPLQQDLLLVQQSTNNSSKEQMTYPSMEFKNTDRNIRDYLETSKLTTKNSILSIDNRDDPQLYNIDSHQNENRGRQYRQKTQALKKQFVSGDYNNISQGLVVTPGLTKQVSNSSYKQPNDKLLSNQSSKMKQSLTEQIVQEKEEIRKILRCYKKQNLSFSKLKIISIDGEGHLEHIRLKQDPLRIIQKEYQHKQNKRLESMQFNEQNTNQLHQLQPLQLLKKEQEHLQIKSQDEIRLFSEEDANDCQEGNKTPFNFNINRPQVKFQNHEIMSFQSPRHQQQNQRMFQVEDDDFVQTHRIIEESFHDHMLLETPANRIVVVNDSKDYNLPSERPSKILSKYDDDYKQELSNSLRNRSTNKKLKRQNSGKIKVSQKSRRESNKYNQYKVDQVINEENQSMQSDDDEVEVTTEAKCISNNNLGTSKQLIKNPTYTRITHASKQMGLPGPTRAYGPTMGIRNQHSLAMNPMLRSMPNFDFLRQINDKTIPFEEISGLQHSSNLDGNSSFIDQKMSTQNLIMFSSPSKELQERRVLNTPSKASHKHIPLFEEFFIIGIQREDLIDLNLKKNETLMVNPQTLYMYTQQNSEECERRRVVKDFCFPDGVEVKELKKSDSLSIAQKILYSQKGSCFIFTMNANDEGASETSLNMSNKNAYMETFPAGSNSEKYYNCLCVVINELVSPQTNFYKAKGLEAEKLINKSKIYTTKKAYCFMFVNSFYQLHMDVIDSLINSIKLERMKLQEENNDPENPLNDTIFRDIVSMLEQPLVTEEMKSILDKYHNLEYDDYKIDQTRIVLDIGPVIGTVSFDIPSIKEQQFLDSYWFCPPLFSLFKIQDFIKLLSAILLERSLVFVGRESLLSTAILGFNSLLYPFKWCLALVPVLPHALIEMLEAPVPFLVGITNKEFKDTTLSQEEKDSKIWVFIEKGVISWQQDGQEFPIFNFNNLQKRIQSNYQKFEKQLNNDMGSSRSSSTSDIQDSNEEMKAICRVLCEKIRKSFKDYILGSLRPLKNKKIQKTENLTRDLGNIILKNSSSQDKPFLEMFLETQMFTTYLDENF